MGITILPQTFTGKFDEMNQQLVKIANAQSTASGGIADAVNLANQATQSAEAKIVDVESRFNTLTSAQQGDSEVVDARKGEVSLRAKIDKIDTAHIAHLAETIHQGKHSTLEATSTDDATSVTSAPLKSAGGLAVAKQSYFGNIINNRTPLRGLTEVVGSKGTFIFDGAATNLNFSYNKQLRVRFKLSSLFDNYRLPCLMEVKFVANDIGISTDRIQAINKSFAFGLTDDGATLKGLTSYTGLRKLILDENVLIQSANDSGMFDLIIKNSTASSLNIGWVLEVTSLQPNSNVTLISYQIENIA